MYYRLNDEYALRAWKFMDRVVYNRFLPNASRLDEETFDLLMQCDGEHEFTENEKLNDLTKQGVISPCRWGEKPSEWSRFRRYEHRFVPSMNLMLTGKCNYNCLHCFNAAENADRMSEWSYDDVIELLDQAADCGIHSITLTGGEPMLHPRFADIVMAIYDRNMVLEKLTTNGYFICEETLALFRELNASPQIKISFDGIGYHDRMRGHKGAEKDTLRALRICTDNGFRTLVQTQVNRINIGSMYDTLDLLEDIGVASTRIIRTTPVPRWVKNAPDGSLPVEDYFEQMLKLAEWYMQSEHTMNVIIWRYLILRPHEKNYSMVMDIRPDGQYRPTLPVCSGNRTMMAVTCEGNVVPCLQMSGYASQLGHTYDDLRKRRLADILKDGEWLDAVCKNHYWLRKQNRVCDSCEWFGHCGGGCRALGMLDAMEKTGEYDYSASDPLACLFFKGGWYDKVRERLMEYKYI